jgi:hypothetical protein
MIINQMDKIKKLSMAKYNRYKSFGDAHMLKPSLARSSESGGFGYKY